MLAERAPICVSELQFESELQRPRGADLVQAAQASVGAAGTETVGKAVSRDAEEGVVGQVSSIGLRADVAEHRMVEHVEGFRAELERNGLVNGKVAPQSEIFLHGIEPAQLIAAEVALGKRVCRRAEMRRVEPPAARTIRTSIGCGTSEP